MKAVVPGFLLVLCLVSFANAEPLPVAALDRTKPVDFPKEIFPVLKANCLACHNSTKAKADLVLESPADMITGGDSGPAVEPGNAEHSLLFTTAAHIEEPVMPPPNNKSNAVNFSPLELALMKRWINEGAKGDRVATEAPRSWTFLSGVQPVYTSAITGSGKFAAVGRGQKIDLYDLRASKLVTNLKDPGLSFPASHGDMVQSLAFNGDDTLASGGFRNVKIWQRKSPALVGELIALEAAVTATAVSADGESYAAGLANGAILLVDLSGKEIEKPVVIKDHSAAVTGIAFSPDGSWIYSVSADKTLRSRSLTEIDQSSNYTFPHPATALSLSEDGKNVFVATGDFQIHTFASSDFTKPASSFKIIDSPVVGLDFQSSDGIIAYKNGTVVQVEKTTGKEIRRTAHGAELASFSASSSRFATAGKTGGIKLWNRGDGKLVAEIKTDPVLPRLLDEVRREVTVWSRINTYWKRKAPESEKLWQSESEKAKQAGAAIAKAKLELRAKTEPEEVRKAEQALTSALRSREDSSRLAGEALVRHSLAQSTALEAETAVAELNKNVEALAKQFGELNSKFAVADLSFSKDGTTLVASIVERGIQFYNADSGTWIDSRESKDKQSTVVGNYIINTSADGKKLQIHTRGEQWELVKTLGNGKDPEPFTDRVAALAFSPDGSQLLTGGGVPSRNGEVVLWNTSDWSVSKKNPQAHSDTITSFAWSPDGKQFVSGATDRLVRTFDAVSLEKIQTFEGHSSHVLDVDWNADGLTLASSGADLQAKVWDLQTLKERTKLTGFKKEVATARFFAGSETVLTASGDNTLKLSNQPLPGAGQTFLHTAAASADGQYIIAGGQDSVLRVWDGKAKKLIHEFPAPDDQQLAEK